MHYASLLYTCLIFLSILSFILHQPTVCRAVIHCKERKKLMVNLMAYFTEKVFSLEGRSKRNPGFGMTQVCVPDTGLWWKQALSEVFESRFQQPLKGFVVTFSFEILLNVWSMAIQIACMPMNPKEKTRGKKMTSQFCTRMLQDSYFGVPF